MAILTVEISALLRKVVSDFQVQPAQGMGVNVAESLDAIRGDEDL